MALGALPHGAFVSYLRTEFACSRSILIGQLEEKLTQRRGGKQRLWVDEIARIVTKVRESMSDETSIIPFDLAKTVDPATALQLTQNYLGLYGKLLTTWEGLLRIFTFFHPGIFTIIHPPPGLSF